MGTHLWIVFGLLSAFTAALVGIFGKIGLAGIDTNLATAVRAVIMAIFLVMVVLFQGKFAHLNSILGNHKALTFIVLSGIAGALSWLFYFWALKFGKVSQVVPIDRLSVVFAIILGAIFLGEALSWKTAMGALLVVIGAILIALA